ncbi:MAG: polysaccharide deacetylase family protein [Deltaproteobacteria bacterium]|nr:polysaccharide deacetylase family protein [Deltaproteobacteria bacterium]
MIFFSILSLSYVGLVLLICSLLLPCFNLGFNAYCQGPPSEKIIALTFDDGPNEPYTSQILDILKEKKIHATFFLVGNHIRRFPETVKRIQQEGHVIGNHTDNHEGLFYKSPQEIREQFDRWEEAMRPFGYQATLFRSPHGWKSPFLNEILRERNMKLMGWTRGVWDSDRPGVDVLFQRITSHPQNGMILLLHDGDGSRESADRSHTAEVLKPAIEFYEKQGFRFVTLNEMMR